MNAHITGRNVVVVASGEDSDVLRKAARKVACGEAHTATIGKLIKVAEGAGKVTYTWGPVVTRAGAAKAAPKAAPAPESGDVSRLVRKIAKLQAELDALVGATVPATREVPEFIARARAATCHTCKDLGVVRGVGADAGKPYRTAKGAEAAKAAGRAVKCPSHKRAPKVA